MNETTVVYNRRIDDGSPLLLRDPPEKGVAAYGVSTLVCDNPECTCTRMYLDIHPAEDTGDGFFDLRRPVLQGVVFSDGSDLKLGRDPSGTLSPDVIRWLGEELARDKYQEWLCERWRRARGQVGDPAYPSPVLPDDLEWLVPFHEVFPYEFDLTVFTGDELYLADDQYCFQPGCSCDEAAVSFVNVNQGKQIGCVRVPVTRLRAAEIEEVPGLHEIWRAFLDQNSRSVLRRRFTKTRTATRLQASPRKGAPHAPKVGRNAPCPCGSGKKFKRCCGDRA